MGYDMYQSHSTYNYKCRWWRRKEEEADLSDELVMKRVPDGQFLAKESSPLYTQNFQVGGVFMFEKENKTIKSPDNLSCLKSEDLVEVNGEKWIVVNVQRSKSRVQNTFFAADNKCSHYWYLELRR